MVHENENLHHHRFRIGLVRLTQADDHFHHTKELQECHLSVINPKSDVIVNNLKWNEFAVITRLGYDDLKNTHITRFKHTRVKKNGHITY